MIIQHCISQKWLAVSFVFFLTRSFRLCRGGAVPAPRGYPDPKVAALSDNILDT